jgi:SlyX protein
MDNAYDTGQRLTDLEIKASFQEDLLDELNRIVVRQQEQIDHLVREVAHLRESGTDSGVGASRNLQDEQPPHY